jgi:hypothetical protein
MTAGFMMNLQQQQQTNHITSAISIIGEKVYVGAKISIFCHHHIKVLQLVSKQLLVLWLLCG